MLEVASYIENEFRGGISRFRNMSTREQNKHLRQKFPQLSNEAIRKQKKRYYDSKIGTVRIRPKTTQKKKVAPTAILTPLIPNDPQIHSLGGGLHVLNESIVEDAIARVLHENPEKALGVAVAWVEKKGRISKEIVEDGQSTEQQKKFYKEVLKNVYT